MRIVSREYITFHTRFFSWTESEALFCFSWSVFGIFLDKTRIMRIVSRVGIGITQNVSVSGINGRIIRIVWPFDLRWLVAMVGAFHWVAFWSLWLYWHFILRSFTITHSSGVIIIAISGPNPMIPSPYNCVQLLWLDIESEVHSFPNFFLLFLKIAQFRSPTRPKTPWQYFVLEVEIFFHIIGQV